MLELGLGNRVALVTGASDGLGLATVNRLAHEGVRVVACARRAEHLEQRIAKIEAEIAAETGVQILPVAMDVTDDADCQRAITTAIDKFGQLDILINNAGASAAGGFAAVSDEQWYADIELKLMAAVRMTRYALPHLQRAGGGSIVNATIGGAKAPLAGTLPTSVTRAAGLNLTKSLANEYASQNIRVNSICIGLLKSAQWERRAADQSVDELYAEMAKKVPLGRVGEASDYADLVAFLCSDSATYITGAAINLDGGMCPVV